MKRGTIFYELPNNDNVGRIAQPSFKGPALRVLMILFDS